MGIFKPKSLLSGALEKSRKVWDGVATEELAKRGERHMVTEPVGQDDAFLRSVSPETQAAMKDRTWAINMEKIDAPEDILDAIRQTGAVAQDPSVKISFKETEATAQAIAEEIGLNPKQFKSLAKAQGWQTAQLRAAGQTVVDSATQVRDSVQLLQARKASGDLSDSDLLGFRQIVARHAALQQTYSGMASEAGRQLGILRKTLTINIERS